MSEGINEEKVIDRVMMIDQWKVSGDVYTQDELNAIGILLDLYQKEKEKNKKYKESDYEDICLENKHLREQLEICQSDLEEMTVANNHKKENWVHKDILNSYISKDKIRKYIKENKRTYEMKTPNRNRVVYKDCVLLTKEVKEILEENNGKQM